MSPASKGQILIEVIIAAALITFISIGLVSLIGAALRGIGQTKDKGAAAFLFQEATEAVRAITKENWLSTGNLATTSANQYYPLATGTPLKWTAATGTEIVSLNDISYTRYFWVDNVYRSTSTGAIVSSGGYWDPSTKKITVRLLWTPPTLGQQEFQEVFYLSRFLNETFGQTDWSGGAVGEQVITTTTTTYTSGTSVDPTTATGSIKLQQQ